MNKDNSVVKSAWDKILSEKQIIYAAIDVLVLRDIYEVLKEEIKFRKINYLMP